jgi:hypothetical protein
MKRERQFLLTAVVLLLDAGLAQTTKVEVPAISDIRLAGAEPGVSLGAISAPMNSPISVQLPLRSGSAITVDATGVLRVGSQTPGAAGTGNYQTLAQRGLSGLIGPACSLAGIFLPQRIDASHTPPLLHFDGGLREVAEMRPLLQQTFYIGTGWTSTGAAKRILVPDGAMSLHLGVHGCITGGRTGSFQALAAVSDTVGYFAQLAEGASWRTTILVLNRSAAQAPYALDFYDDLGRSLDVPLAAASAPRQGSLPAGGSVEIVTDGGSEQLRQGWAVLRGSPSLFGVAVFRQSIPGRQDAEAAVFLTDALRSLVLPYDQRANFVSGIALANTEDTPATVTLEFHTETGAPSGRSSVALGPRAHTAFALGSAQAPSGSPSSGRGTILVKAESGKHITALGLRFSPSGSFTTIPVAPND